MTVPMMPGTKGGLGEPGAAHRPATGSDALLGGQAAGQSDGAEKR